MMIDISHQDYKDSGFILFPDENLSLWVSVAIQESVTGFSVKSILAPITKISST